jgi:hypothetical protein
MNAAVALAAATAVGVRVAVDGDDLLLEAARRPPDAIVEDLRRHKPAIVSMLRGGRGEAIAQQKPANRHGGAPVEWSNWLAALTTAAPAEGFTPTQWRQLVVDAERFLHDWGEEAARHGWTLLEAFGVHMRAPSARYDGMGLVPLLRGGEVIALNADRATVRTPSGSHLIFLRRTCPDFVPIWEIARVGRNI